MDIKISPFHGVFTIASERRLGNDAIYLVPIIQDINKTIKASHGGIELWQRQK